MGRRLNDLPDEIILEILTRLPAESALDCKLVCKPWRDLVRHPPFAQMHLNHLNNSVDDDPGKLSIIIMSRENGFHYTEFNELCGEILLSRKTRMSLCPAVENFSFVGSCNGLICLKSISLNVHNHRLGPAYICNPITREYIILPSLQGHYQWSGFGYSHSTNEYKVVRICFTSTDPNFGMAQVYTIGGGNGWRRSLGGIGMNWKYRKCSFICSGVFVNGALHWVNRDNGSILAFDLTDEKFSELPSPPCLTWNDVPYYSLYFGVLGDFLCAMYQHDANCSEIWSWKKSTDNIDWSWNKQFCFNNHIERPLSEFTKSGRILCYGSVGIYSYDPKASSAKMDVSRGMSISEAIPHKNTLVSLKALGEKDTKKMDFHERARSEVIPHKNTLVSLKALGEKDAKKMSFPERARSSEVIKSSLRSINTILSKISLGKYKV